MMDNTSGWRCPGCGEFVMHNTTHMCSGSLYPPYVPAPTLLESQTDTEILKRLDEIIDLLKKIKKRMK